MDIVQRSSLSSTRAASTPGTGTPAANQADDALADGSSASSVAEGGARAVPAPLRRGVSNIDQPLQSDISSAQQAIDFLEQSAAQLRALKTDISAKLVTRQMRDGQVEQRLRDFADTWRNRSAASGGTLDAQLNYSTEPAQQRFTVRGMTLANLRNGARETLAVSVGGGVAGLRSVHLGPGMSDGEIATRFDQALAPAGVRVSVNQNGELVFSTPEASWPTVRDAFAVQGGGVRYAGGQLNRVKTDAQAPAVVPDNWGASDIESMRATLQQVTQALAHVEEALAKVRQQLSLAAKRADATVPDVEMAGMGEMAEVFASLSKEPGYQQLVQLTSALVGINRERVISLLRLG